MAARFEDLPDALGPISPSRADSWRSSSEVALRCGGQWPRAEANLDSSRSTFRITLSSCISCSRWRLRTCTSTRLDVKETPRHSCNDYIVAAGQL